MEKYHSILVAVDATSDSVKLIQKGLLLADSDPARVFVVHVVEPFYPADTIYEPMLFPMGDEILMDDSARVDSVRKHLEDLLRQEKCETDNLYVASGLAKSEILERARTVKADLIICGSHGRSGFELLLGSTANAIVNHAECDVLAVRTASRGK